MKVSMASEITLEPNYNDNVYMVHYMAGTRGMLVTLLLWHYLSLDKSRLPLGKNMFGKHGTAHPIVRVIFSNYDWIESGPSQFISGQLKGIPKLHPRYYVVKQKEDTVPFIITNHGIPEYEKVKELFPNARLVIIKFDKNDLQDICELIYLKIRVELLNETKTMDKMVPSIMQDILNGEPVDFFTNPVIPDNFKENTLIIPFKDLLKPSLLETLSLFTGKPTTDYISTYHQMYIDAQPNQTS
jgi:hypothetical protein